MTGSISATVAISAVTSAIVSVITFVIGVRLTKNQGDRAVLRETYSKLFEHFRNLRDAIDSGAPKAWPDFPREGDRFVPVFAKMLRTGEGHLLPAALAERCEKIETDSLIAGGRYRQWTHQTYIPALRAIVEKEVSQSTQSITGRRYRPVTASEWGLMTEDDFNDLMVDVKSQEMGVGIELATERGRTELRYVYPEKLDNVSVEAFLKSAWQLGADDAQAKKMRADLTAVRADLEALIGAISARIRDPHPLLESIAASLKDAVRGR